jgi:hypothetical protein
MKFPRRQFLRLAMVPRRCRLHGELRGRKPIRHAENHDVPFTPGGPTDVVGRIVVERMKGSLRQPPRHFAIRRMLTKEGGHGQAESFSFVCDVDGNGGVACLGLRRGAREWAGKDAKLRIHPGLFRCLESSVLSLVRAARIGSRPGDEQVALALHRESAAFSLRRFSGIASEQGRAWGERL